MPNDELVQTNVQMNSRNPLVRNLVNVAIQTAPESPSETQEAQIVADMVMATAIMIKLVGISADQIPALFLAADNNAAIAAQGILQGVESDDE